MALKNDENVTNVISYLIENTIIFFPSQSTVRNIITNESATLFMPATRCLVALIQSQGQVINQRELMDAGWNSVGLSVTSNAYYQNISNIRRAFKIVSGSDNSLPEILTTIKRAGLLIDEKISIVAHHEYETAISIDAQASQTINSRQSLSIHSPSLKYHAAIIIIFLAAYYIMTSNYSFKSKNAFLDNYTIFRTTPTGCHIYLNNDSMANISDSKIYHTKNFTCHGYTNAYLTRYQNQTRTSVLFCSQNLSKLTCLSYYYASHSNEN